MKSLNDCETAEEFLIELSKDLNKNCVYGDCRGQLPILVQDDLSESTTVECGGMGQAFVLKSPSKLKLKSYLPQPVTEIIIRVIIPKNYLTGFHTKIPLIAQGMLNELSRHTDCKKDEMNIGTYATFLFPGTLEPFRQCENPDFVEMRLYSCCRKLQDWIV